MREADEYGVIPNIDTNVPPSDLEQWSLAPSASAQVQQDLVTQTRLRQVAERKACEIRIRCKALEAKLIAEQNAGKRKVAAAAASGAARAEQPPPNKRRSSAALMTNLMAYQRRAVDHLSDEEDDAPSSPEEQTAKLPTFEDLNSIVTECEMGRVKPSFDGDITFNLCAEMCEEESGQVDAWTSEEKVQRHPMILSALRKLYPRKPDSWYETKAYLKSPRGTALYWKKVLDQKAKAWRARHQREKKKANKKKTAASSSSLTPVQQRIKEKLAKRNSPASNKPAREGRKSTPIVIGSESSNSDNSDSNDDTQVSISPTQPDFPAAQEPKLAPGPETYTRGEMKTFARMAATINNVDVAKGHSAAVADFVDSEFFDNSGMMSKARRAPKDSWVKSMFNSACEKAAKIMEERCE